MQKIPLKNMPATLLHSGEDGSIFCYKTDGRAALALVPEKILDAQLNLISQINHK